MGKSDSKTWLLPLMVLDLKQTQEVDNGRRFLGRHFMIPSQHVTTAHRCRIHLKMSDN